MHWGSFAIGLAVTFAIFTWLPTPTDCGCAARKHMILTSIGEVIGGA